MSVIVNFDEYVPTGREALGGKNTSLAELTAAGFPVPPGFAVTTDAFPLVGDNVAAEVGGLVDQADQTDASTLELASRRIRDHIESIPLDVAVAEEVAAAYHRLCRRCGMADVPVAVRSSAVGEDSSEASFAGVHETYLGVRGVDDLLRHIVYCWSSLWTVRAIRYRAEGGHGRAAMSMSVGVQQMVHARAAGVALTLNPANGDRSQVAVDASWGLGPAVVAGEVTPDHFLIDKVVFQITHRQVSQKQVEYRVRADAVERSAVPSERCGSPCLTDAEILAVARLARRVEQHYGAAQDIEWAVDERSASEAIVLLQARPETVWSRKSRRLRCQDGGLASIVSTLCTPLHARESER